MAGVATFLETFAGILDGAAILAHCRTRHSADYYRAQFDDTSTAAWLAETEVGRGPVGFALLTRPDLPAPDPAATDLELQRIYLLSRFHGGGAGRELLAAAVEEARGRGAKRLLLGVFHENHRAIAFYRKSGFEPVGRRTYHVGPRGYDDVVMALAL